MNLKLSLVENIVLSDWLNVSITLQFTHYLLHINVYFNYRKNVKFIPDYIYQRKNIAVISGASAATVSLTGQKGF